MFVFKEHNVDQNVFKIFIEASMMVKRDIAFYIVTNPSSLSVPARSNQIIAISFHFIVYSAI